MGFFDRLLGKAAHETSGDGEPVFKKKETRNDETVYEIFSSPNPERAIQFLSTQKVTKPFHYIIVETPYGNWGLDKEGIYREELLSWQKKIFLYDCNGTFIPLTWSEYGLKHAAMGVTDNFVLQIKCGNCNHQWLDGIQYQNETVVQCPQCKAKNKIDSKNIFVEWI